MLFVSCSKNATGISSCIILRTGLALLLTGEQRPRSPDSRFSTVLKTIHYDGCITKTHMQMNRKNCIACDFLNTNGCISILILLLCHVQCHPRKLATIATIWPLKKGHWCWSVTWKYCVCVYRTFHMLQHMDCFTLLRSMFGSATAVCNEHENHTRWCRLSMLTAYMSVSVL